MNGTPIGSPISSVLADLLIDYVHETIVTKFSPKVVFYYVDDSWVILGKEKLVPLLDCLNNVHPNLKYTHEIEDENKISFLDLVINRCDDGSLITNLYVKQKKSSRTINFLSQHPPHQKKNLVRNEFLRIKNVSHSQFLEENTIQLVRKFSENFYPPDYVQNIIDKTNNINDNKNSIKKPDQNLKFSSLTYIPGVSEEIKRIFKTAGFEMAFTTRKPLKHLINNKSREELMDTSNVVYLINCKSCEEQQKSSVYIGQTKKRLRERINQHCNNVKKQQLTTALSIHATDHKHSFDFENPKILTIEKDVKKREFLESYHIMMNPASINFMCEREKASLHYNNILFSAPD